jgi:subtilisin family serine protease
LGGVFVLLPRNGKEIPENKRIIDQQIKKGILKKGIWKKREIEFAPGEIIIKFKQAHGQYRSSKDDFIQNKLSSHNLKDVKLKKPFNNKGRGLIEVEPKIDILTKCLELSEDPDIEFAEPNMRGRVARIPNDNDYPNQWALPLINAPAAWDIEIGSGNVLIAVLDTGIAMDGTPLSLSHPDLNDATRIILGHDYVNNDANPRDDYGHGTHVAGIASAQTDNTTGIAGLSWLTRLYIVKVMDSWGYFWYSDLADGIDEAVDYAVANNMRLVINISGGGVSSSQDLENAIIHARDNDCLIVVATGNHVNPGDPEDVLYPAAYSAIYDNIIGVSNTDSNDQISASSNYGPGVNVAAPGTDIFSTMPNYAVTMTTAYGYSQNYDNCSGTSMATPHVAALAALILSCDNTLSPAEIRIIIESRVNDLGDPGWDEYYGFGRIDAYEALKDYEDGWIIVKPEWCEFKIETAVCSRCDNLLVVFCGKCDLRAEYYYEQCPKTELDIDIPCSRGQEVIPCARYGEAECLKEAWDFPYERYGQPFRIRSRISSKIRARNFEGLKHIRPLTRMKRSRRKKIKKRYYPSS